MTESYLRIDIPESGAPIYVPATLRPESDGDWELIAGKAPLRVKLDELVDRLTGVGLLMEQAREQLLCHIDPPERLEIEVGIAFTAEGSILVAKSSTELSMSLRATWAGQRD